MEFLSQIENSTKKYSKFPAPSTGFLPRWCITWQSQSSPLQVMCEGAVNRQPGNRASNLQRRWLSYTWNRIISIIPFIPMEKIHEWNNIFRLNLMNISPMVTLDHFNNFFNESWRFDSKTFEKNREFKKNWPSVTDLRAGITHIQNASMTMRLSGNPSQTYSNTRLWVKFNFFL